MNQTANDFGATGPPRRFRKALLQPAVRALVLGLALSGAAWFAALRYWDEPNTQTDIDASGQYNRVLLQTALGDLQDTVASIAAHFQSLDRPIDREQFRTIVTNLGDATINFDQLAWIPRVPRLGRASLEQAAAREGPADYGIGVPGLDGKLVPAGERDVYFPVLYVAGAMRTPLVAGLDLGADEAILPAIERARDGDWIAGSRVVDVQANSGRRQVVFVVIPVYRLGLPHATMEERRRNFQGIVAGVVSPELVLESMIRNLRPTGLDIQLFDDSGTPPTTLPFYVHSSRLRSAPAEPRPLAELKETTYWAGQVTFGDRNWTMTVTPIPGGPLLTNHEYSAVVLAAGLIITAIFASYLGVLTRQGTRLAASQAELKAIFEHALDGIVLYEIETKKLHAGNDRLCRMLGYTSDELVTLSVSDIHPAEQLPHVIEQLERQISGEIELATDIPVKRRDGSVFFADISAAPVVIDGKQYLVGIFHDITERKSAAEVLQRRDALLHAIALSATEIMTTPSLEDAIHKAMGLVSTAIRIDRMGVMERSSAPDLPPLYRYAWNALDVKVAIDDRFFEKSPIWSPQIAAWQAPLSEGKVVMTDALTATGDVRKMLEFIGAKSILLVPVFVDAKYWGMVGFDSCKQERTWLDFEREILRMLADQIGSAIQRERHLKEIADANRIIMDTPTVLYRLRGEPGFPMLYISQNIRLFGYEPAALVTSPHLYKSLVHPDDVKAVGDLMAHLLETNAGSGVIEYRLMTSRGDYRWVENHYGPVRDAAGRIVEIEGLFTDITERKASDEKISLLARTDPLTALPNRTTFIERLGLSFAAARRGASAFAVLYLDLDRFKDVNDTQGHAVGDRLLIMVGERLKSAVRETDLVGRLGGDEFAVLQADLFDDADAGTLAIKIRAALAVPLQIAGSELRITASVGIAIYAPETATPEDMLAQADVALYRAKEEGRDQYRFHTEELDHLVSERVAIAEELRLAIERSQFELYYQPQVDLDSGRIVGVEALIRWNHPTRGVLAPANFLPIAEATGTMRAIGQWVLDRACWQMSLWRKAGIAPPVLAINVSLVQLKTPDEYLEIVSETLAKYEMAPADLEIDVTESMLAHTVSEQNDAVEQLQALGVTIAIDDFGAKFSSLDYIRNYHVGRIKIPKLIIDSAAHDPSSATMVRAIIGIARELNIEVVAQGVETKEQWSYLSATRPTPHVQGFYYSEPVPAGRAEALLRLGRIEPAVPPGTPLPAERPHKRAL